MSEFENEFEDENVNPAGEAQEPEAASAEPETDVVEDSKPEAAENVAEVETEAGEEEAAADEPQAAEPTDAELDEQLWDKTNKAARLLRNRRAALQKEQEDRGGRPSLLVRGIKLLQLKPKMTQKEMADLLGVKLHELDTVLADAEQHDIIARVEPEEPDMRKVVVMADEDSVARAEAYESKGERFVPGMSAEETATMLALLDKVIAKLTAMGLDDEREKPGFHGGDRDHRGGDRGGRGGFGGHRDDRGGFGGHRDDRGGRGNDRGGRGGFGGGSRGGNRGGFRSGGYDHRGGDRGGRGGFGGRRDDRGGNRGGHRDDRGSFRSNRGNRY